MQGSEIHRDTHGGDSVGKGFLALEGSFPPSLHCAFPLLLLVATEGQTAGKSAFGSLGGLIKAPGLSFRSPRAL